MKKLAPEILRKRLLVEGYYSIDVNESVIKDFFQKVTKDLELRMYGEPIIFSPEGLGSGENQGYDAFVPLIDSGISLYVWSEKKFLSVVFYTCKDFDEEKALACSKAFFQMGETATFGF